MGHSRSRNFLLLVKDVLVVEEVTVNVVDEVDLQNVFRRPSRLVCARVCVCVCLLVCLFV